MPMITIGVQGLRDQTVEVTQYNSLQILPTMEHDGVCRQAYDYEEPHQWSVYGRLQDGTAEWIADFQKELLAWLFVTHCSWTLEIPIEDKTLNAQVVVNACNLMNQKGIKQ